MFCRIRQGNNLSVDDLYLELLFCFVLVRAYGVNKVDKGPREVLNPEIQKVRLKLVQGKDTDGRESTLALKI